MSFVDDVDSLKTKLHLRDMPTSLRIGLVLLGAIILFILFQGLCSSLPAIRTSSMDRPRALGKREAKRA